MLRITLKDGYCSVISMNNSIQKLLVDKKSLASEIAEEANGFLRIDKTTCTPILPFTLGRLTSQERILIELGTAFLCFVAGIVKNSKISREILQKRCKLAPAALRARLSELRKNQLVNSSDEGEEITATGLIELRELLRYLRREESNRKVK